jgi:hypothetical protein
LFEVAAESRGAAGFDGAHDAQLLARQPVRGPLGGSMSSKNGGHLQRWPHHFLPGFFLRLS